MLVGRREAELAESALAAWLHQAAVFDETAAVDEYGNRIIPTEADDLARWDAANQQLLELLREFETTVRKKIR